MKDVDGANGFLSAWWRRIGSCWVLHRQKAQNCCEGAVLYPSTTGNTAVWYACIALCYPLTKFCNRLLQHTGLNLAQKHIRMILSLYKR